MNIAAFPEFLGGKAMRINLFGQRNNLGVGRHFGEFADALRSIKIIGDAVTEFDYCCAADNQRCVESAGSDDVNIHFVNVDTLPSSLIKHRWPKLPGFNIHWAIFEATILPENTITWLKSADLVFVPSKWGKRVLIENGIEFSKIEVLPEGVNPLKFHPHLRKNYNTRQDEIYRVLVVSKYEERKGFPDLLQGFSKAFKNEPKVQLILKSDNLWMKQLGDDAYDQNVIELEQEVQKFGITNCKFFHGELSDTDIFHLYNACDVLLFPSRSEGWGLPLMEAISAGMPAITTYYSGHTEFLEPIKEKVGILEHQMVPMGPDGSHGKWAQASGEAISKTLGEMRINANLHQRNALEASQILRRDFSWQAAAEKFIGTLSRRGLNFSISLEL